jgi:glycerate 2-kinase
VSPRDSLPAQARSIWSAGLKAAEGSRLVQAWVEENRETLLAPGGPLDLSRFRRVFTAALGKAAAPMTRGLLPFLGGRLTRGVLVGSPGTRFRHPRFLVLPGPHPLPDRRSVQAARSLLDLAREAGPRDLFILLLSGGASAQACLPVPGVGLRDLRRLTNRLLRAGADIGELNAVRKHLSAFKGGRLAAAAFPAAGLNLVLSDVPGNDLETIGSGPTHWDSTTFARAKAVFEKYGEWRAAPVSIRKAIGEGLRGRAPETLKRRDPVFGRVRSFVVGDAGAAVGAAAGEARRLGFRTRVISLADRGEAREAARSYVALLSAGLTAGSRAGGPLCLLAGGELTVTVRGRGCGGRNSEFVLAALLEMEQAPLPGLVRVSGRRPAWLVASLGTDGRDGPTDAAGAWATAGVAARAVRLGLEPRDYLDRNDSYSFFERAGGLVRTGPTGTNVMDLRLLLARPA